MKYAYEVHLVGGSVAYFVDQRKLSAIHADVQEALTKQQETFHFETGWVSMAHVVALHEAQDQDDDDDDGYDEEPAPPVRRAPMSPFKRPPPKSVTVQEAEPADQA